MGKPPRKRPAPTLTPSSSSSGDAPNMDGFDTGTARNDGTALDLGPFSSVTDGPTGWNAVDDATNGLLINPDALNGLYTTPPGSSLPTSTSLDFSEWTDPSNDDLLSANLHFGALSTPEPSDFGSYASTRAPTAQPNAHHFHSDKRSSHDSANFTGHDCPREASHILGSLTSINPNNAQSLPSTPVTASGSLTGECFDGVPIDQVLRLNREASERLSNLLNCSCARSPDLALLYASIISRILIWYQQVAGSQSSGFGVASARMAIGSFNVDDLRVQTALKMQLLLGEMKRAGCLVEQFTSCNAGSAACMTNDGNFGGADGLYQNLDTWLRNEHSRITNLMREKLGELST
ncbi:MAG: hypothetical protein Q9162_002742 [Coniocarpon cinnabarinum]